MTRTAIAGAAMVLALTFAPLGTAAAQEAPPASDAAAMDAYERTVAAMQTPRMKTAAIDGVLEALFLQLVSEDEEMAALAEAEPGFGPAFKASLRPIFADVVEENMAIAASALTALLRERLNEEEAGDVAAFFAAPEMQNLIMQTHAQNRHESVLAPENADSDITEEQIIADRRRAAARVSNDLSAAERLNLTLLSSSEGVQKFMALQGEISAINLAIENRPLDPAIEAEMLDAMLTVFDKYGLWG